MTNLSETINADNISLKNTSVVESSRKVAMRRVIESDSSFSDTSNSTLPTRQTMNTI